MKELRNSIVFAILVLSIIAIFFFAESGEISVLAILLVSGDVAVDATL